MKATYCAWCLVALPRPAAWKTPEGAVREVRDWHEAVDAYGKGYRYMTPDWLVYGIHAVTFVSGTAVCYGHGYFLAKDLIYSGNPSPASSTVGGPSVVE